MLATQKSNGASTEGFNGTEELTPWISIQLISASNSKRPADAWRLADGR
jgi:hypothetical protein